MTTDTLAIRVIVMCAALVAPIGLVAQGHGAADAINSSNERVDRRVLEAFEAFQNDEVDEAERRCRGIIREFSRDLEAKVLLADLLVEYGSARAEPLNLAGRLLDEVLEADPAF